MRFYSLIKNNFEEHGFFHVLFNVQVAWMASLGITKKNYRIKGIATLLMSPVFFFLGYGKFAEAIKLAGSTNYDHALANLVAMMFLFMHWAGWIFPYVLFLNIFTFFAAKMWSNKFWEQVELAK